jgi:hypothetical protein
MRWRVALVIPECAHANKNAAKTTLADFDAQRYVKFHDKCLLDVYNYHLCDSELCPSV